MDAPSITADDEIASQLERRLGRTHARLRLGLEADHEAQVFGQGINYFHFENLPLSHVIIRTCLRATGLYGRGRRNAGALTVRDNLICSKRLPRAFDGFLHPAPDGSARRNQRRGIVPTCIGCCRHSTYDICVFTGDYRAQTHGSWHAALAGLALVCKDISRPMYGVLGNHDTIRMLPSLEDMGIQMLMNRKRRDPERR